MHKCCMSPQWHLENWKLYINNYENNRNPPWATLNEHFNFSPFKCGIYPSRAALISGLICSVTRRWNSATTATDPSTPIYSPLVGGSTVTSSVVSILLVGKLRIICDEFCKFTKSVVRQSIQFSYSSLFLTYIFKFFPGVTIFVLYHEI